MKLHGVIAVLTIAMLVVLPVGALACCGNTVNCVNNNNQEQNQEQQQEQQQQQDQQQTQSVTVVTTQGSSSGYTTAKVATLDVQTAIQHSRLMYPGEVLTFKVQPGDVVTLVAASDVGLYTIGWFGSLDLLKVKSSESTPVYDMVYNKMEWGIVSPVDFIDYWTAQDELVCGTNAQYVVIDNRAPGNGYTHVDYVIYHQATV
jgi:hypothetical protein